jgi:ribonucleoside-diphosphate reductase alpha chain
MEFLELRLNTGPDELRARDLFLAMWIPDLFMKCVKENGDWYLMNPDECTGLQDAIGEEFERLYYRYVSEGKYVRKLPASKVWEKIMISQIETGVPYIGFKDNVNRKSNQINVGVVKSSNLCIEITEVSTHNSYAVCNLASICVNRFLKPDGTYDWDQLHRVAKLITYNLNQVIDNNYYPTPETKENNFANRPIGIGIQGLADLLCKMKLPFESDDAIRLDGDIMETIYHGAVEMSAELAQKYGSYPNFHGSPFSKGVLQFDLWSVTPRRYDWTELKEKVKKGMRNSLLTALMPTATTSQIQGHTECFEPVTSNIYTRKTMAGNFMVVNKYLIEDLKALDLWDLNTKNDIIDNRGSIQNIERIPQTIRDVYKTAWEIKQRAVIDHAIARSPYVDQSQSMNLFMATPTYEKITSALFYAWQNGLKTGCYYLRSLPAIAPQQFSQEVKRLDINKDSGTETKNEEAMFCSLANPEACSMCSS